MAGFDLVASSGTLMPEPLPAGFVVPPEWRRVAKERCPELSESQIDELADDFSAFYIERGARHRNWAVEWFRWARVCETRTKREGQ